MSACKRCHRPIMWVKVEKSGRLMPVDPDPTHEGNVLRTGRTAPNERGGRPTDLVTVLSGAEMIIAQAQHEPGRLMPHAATCTNPPPKKAR